MVSLVVAELLTSRGLLKKVRLPVKSDTFTMTSTVGGSTY